jgi:hypothetical protein
MCARRASHAFGPLTSCSPRPTDGPLGRLMSAALAGVSALALAARMKANKSARLVLISWVRFRFSSTVLASRPSRIRNQTIPREATASTHHAPMASCTMRAATTTRDSQPQVMLSTASALSARLPSVSARASLRRERKYIIGTASTHRMRPGSENSAPIRVLDDEALCAVRRWLPGNSAVCYRLRRSRVHLGNVG